MDIKSEIIDIAADKKCMRILTRANKIVTVGADFKEEKSVEKGHAVRVFTNGSYCTVD